MYTYIYMRWNIEKKKASICDRVYKNRGERNRTGAIFEEITTEFPKPDETYQPTFKKL